MRNLALSFALLASTSAVAKPTAPPPAPADDNAGAPAEHFAFQPGPVKIDLPNNIKLDVPANEVFLNAADGKRLLEKSHNLMGDSFMGMLLPKDENASYWIAIEYADEGYVKDDEKIDAGEILDGIKEGQKEANKEMADKGFPPLFIDNWSEPPHYDKAAHQLIWALNVHSDDAGKSVNYNTRMLGRKGFVSVNLITDPEKLATYKPDVQNVLQHITFSEGSRYTDFNSKTDKVATYGLVGLIAGGAGIAVLKSGILAKLGILLIKFIKPLIVAVVAFFGYLRRLVTGKRVTVTRPVPPSMVNTSGNAPNSEQGPPTDAPSHPPTDDFK